MPLIFHPLFVLADGSGGAVPFHPFLVNFTAGLLPASVVFDVLGAVRKNERLRSAAWWTLLAAAVVTPLTALAGWLWVGDRDHGAHWQIGIHQWLGTGLAAALIPLAIWRGRLYRADRRPRWPYFGAAALVLAAVSVQGELGASMSFGRGILIHGYERQDKSANGAGQDNH